MKKFVILTIVMSIIVMFNACKKDSSLQENQNLDPTEQKILNFKEKLESGDKSGETMSIDSAVWYIEAALNYTYCDTASSVIGIDSVFISVNVSDDGNINFSDVVAAYNQLNDNLITIIGENSMRLADIEFVNNSDKSGQEELKLTVVETIAQFPEFPDLNFDWFTGAGRCLMCRCDGTDCGKSAATVWSNALTVSIGVPANSYLTNIRIGETFTNSPNYPTPWQYDKWLYTKYAESSPCVSKSSMQRYYDYAREEIVNNYNPPQGWGKAYVDYKTEFYGFPGWIWSFLRVYEGEILYYNPTE